MFLFLGVEDHRHFGLDGGDQGLQRLPAGGPEALKKSGVGLKRQRVGPGLLDEV